MSRVLYIQCSSVITNVLLVLPFSFMYCIALFPGPAQLMSLVGPGNETCHTLENWVGPGNETGHTLESWAGPGSETGHTLYS